jgi:hypothetical protein
MRASYGRRSAFVNEDGEHIEATFGKDVVTESDCCEDKAKAASVISIIIIWIVRLWFNIKILGRIIFHRPQNLIGKTCYAKFLRPD